MAQGVYEGAFGEIGRSVGEGDPERRVSDQYLFFGEGQEEFRRDDESEALLLLRVSLGKEQELELSRAEGSAWVVVGVLFEGDLEDAVSGLSLDQQEFSVSDDSRV